eukprot:484064-Heterocapsa_arctica.AAC.1
MDSLSFAPQDMSAPGDGSGEDGDDGGSGGDKSMRVPAGAFQETVNLSSLRRYAALQIDPRPEQLQ